MAFLTRKFTALSTDLEKWTVKTETDVGALTREFEKLKEVQVSVLDSPIRYGPPAVPTTTHRNHLHHHHH